MIHSYSNPTSSDAIKSPYAIKWSRLLLQCVISFFVIIFGLLGLQRLNTKYATIANVPACNSDAVFAKLQALNPELTVWSNPKEIKTINLQRDCTAQAYFKSTNSPIKEGRMLLPAPLYYNVFFKTPTDTNYNVAIVPSFSEAP